MPSGSVSTKDSQPSRSIDNMPPQHGFPHGKTTNNSLRQRYNNRSPLGSYIRRSLGSSLHTRAGLISQPTRRRSHGSSISREISHHNHESGPMDLDDIHDIYPLPNRSIGQRASLENVTTTHVSQHRLNLNDGC